MMNAGQTPSRSDRDIPESIPLTPLYPPPIYARYTPQTESLPPHYLEAGLPQSYQSEINDSPQACIQPERLAKKEKRLTVIVCIVIILLVIVAVVVMVVLDPILDKCAWWVEPLVTVGILLGFFIVGFGLCALLDVA